MSSKKNYPHFTIFDDIGFYDNYKYTILIRVKQRGKIIIIMYVWISLFHEKLHFITVNDRHNQLALTLTPIILISVN